MEKNTNNEIKNTVDLDDVLKEFSLFGKYHVKTWFLLFLLCVYMKFSTMSYVLVTAPVAYSCKDNENATCSSFNSTFTCAEWIYDDNNSFVAEFDLACQDWKRTLIGTVHSLGYMVGLIIIGPISDKIGRKKAIIATSVASGFTAVVRSFANSYWMFLALEFLETVVGDAFSPLFMIVVEIVSTDKRLAFMTITNMGYSIGGITMGLLAYLFPYWRTFIRVIYAPALLFVLYYFLLDESPRWLLANGRKEKAIAIIERAAKTNNIKIDKDRLEKLHYEKEETVHLVEVMKSTFKSRALLKRFFVSIVWWITSTFVNYGMTINSVSLQGNKYLNFAFQFLVEIPGMWINVLVMKFLKRKRSLIVYFFLGAVLCLSQPFVPTNLIWLSIFLYMGGKLMSMLYFETTYLYTSELFPTYTRNSMHALCSSIGRIGSIIAPQTPLLMAYWSGLPALVFGGSALFASLVTFLVPDTADDNLPDTVRQAEEIGNKKPGNNISVGNHNHGYVSNEQSLDLNYLSQRNCTSL